jgi:hypothetical protein
MATERLSMRQIRQILRQKWGVGRTQRVAHSLGISCGAVGTTVLGPRAAGLDWAQVNTLSDEALQVAVYGPPTPPTHHRVIPTALTCMPSGASLASPSSCSISNISSSIRNGYRYTQFCEFYRRGLRRRGL